MIVDERIRAWVRLHAAGLPLSVLAALLRAFGGPEGLLEATPAQRRRVVAADAAALLERPEDASRIAATLGWLRGENCTLIAWGDAQYPPSLLQIADSPPVLFCLGRQELLGRPALAIVGSRNATPQGLADAEAFAASLSAAGFAIVSGLAIGIDAAAHRGGLSQAGSSIAVVGTGLDRVYPAANRALAHDLASRGLLVSEYAPGTPALKHHFPHRNRLVSGLSRGVLVVEATLSSGSLITARLAGEQGREVFALPGSIHSPFARGCHRLIREGAKLIETADDILAELDLSRLGPPRPRSEPSGMAEDPVLAALGYDPADVDTLATRSKLSAAEVSAALTALELDGLVAPIAGGLWQRRR
jgi:DNA processing protein